MERSKLLRCRPTPLFTNRRIPHTLCLLLPQSSIARPIACKLSPEQFWICTLSLVWVCRRTCGSRPYVRRSAATTLCLRHPRANSKPQHSPPYHIINSTFSGSRTWSSHASETRCVVFVLLFSRVARLLLTPLKPKHCTGLPARRRGACFQPAPPGASTRRWSGPACPPPRCVRARASDDGTAQHLQPLPLWRPPPPGSPINKCLNTSLTRPPRTVSFSVTPLPLSGCRCFRVYPSHLVHLAALCVGRGGDDPAFLPHQCLGLYPSLFQPQRCFLYLSNTVALLVTRRLPEANHNPGPLLQVYPLRPAPNCRFGPHCPLCFRSPRGHPVCCTAQYPLLCARDQ
jgi:hypothetical protein